MQICIHGQCTLEVPKFILPKFDNFLISYVASYAKIKNTYNYLLRGWERLLPEGLGRLGKGMVD